MIQEQIDELKIDLQKLKEKEILFGTAKYEDSKFSLRPIVNTEAI